MIVEPKREILLRPLLRAGLRRSWAARDHFLRLAIIPLAMMLTIIVPLRHILITNMAVAQAESMPVDGGPMPQVALLSLTYTAVLCFFAVNWLRQLTLGISGAPGVGLTLSGRHLKFVLLILTTSLGSGFLGVILMLALSGFGLPGVLGALMASLLLWAALIVRISPSWIGIALDAPMPMRIAWRRTAGQGFKLVTAMLAVEVPLLVLQWTIGSAFEVTGLVLAAPMTLILITAILQLVGIAAQLAVLVTAFPHFLRETV